MNLKIFLESMNNLNLNVVESFISHYYDSYQSALKAPPYFDKVHADTALNDVYAHVLEGENIFFVNITYNFETTENVDLTAISTFLVEIDTTTHPEDHLQLKQVKLRKVAVYDSNAAKADSVMENAVQNYFSTSRTQVENDALELITSDIERLISEHPEHTQFFNQSY